MAQERRAIWLQRLEQWRESGLTARKFAAQIGVNPGTLSSWKYKVAAGRAGGQTAATAERVEFVEVIGAPASLPINRSVEERLEVVCPDGRTVRVPRTFDAETLVRLLDVLERR